MTKHHIDAAIDRWIRALEALPVRSVHGDLLAVAQLGCRTQSSRRATLPVWVGLRAAELPLRLCTTRERAVLWLRYAGMRKVRMERNAPTGKGREEYYRPLLPRYEAIAARLDTTAKAIEQCVTRARAKIRQVLDEETLTR